ncbi:hypothetical protein [Bartonella florencae]|uniref:hypothetical protein n=1 Tax=Bartonella florencae TaxID=928210 RepID=UPI0003182835|nr:hypothetical protein [Bartonella florencae]
MGSSSSSHDSNSSHSSSWFHSDSCDVGGYAYDVGMHGLLGLGAGAAAGAAVAGVGAGPGALSAGLYESATTLVHKLDECFHR